MLLCCAGGQRPLLIRCGRTDWMMGDLCVQKLMEHSGSSFDVSQASQYTEAEITPLSLFLSFSLFFLFLSLRWVVIVRMVLVWGVVTPSGPVRFQYRNSLCSQPPPLTFSLTHTEVSPTRTRTRMRTHTHTDCRLAYCGHRTGMMPNTPPPPLQPAILEHPQTAQTHVRHHRIPAVTPGNIRDNVILQKKHWLCIVHSAQSYFTG